MTTFTKVFRRSAYPAIAPTNPANSQAGRTILITGSTGGNGFNAAHAFLHADARRVVVTGRQADKLREAASELGKIGGEGRVVAVQHDMSDEASVRALWRQLSQQDIAVDTLVLDAAALSAVQDRERERERVAEMWRKFENNVLSLLRMTEHFLEQGPDTGKVILNVTTARAHANPQPSHDGYAPSKVAITKAFEGLADHTPREVCRVVNVSPGIIKTPALVASGLGEEWMYDDPDLSAGFYVWVTGQQAVFLHGRFLWTNWDVDELERMKDRFAREPGLLKIGLNGVDNVHPSEYVAHLMESSQHESRDP